MLRAILPRRPFSTYFPSRSVYRARKSLVCIRMSCSTHVPMPELTSTASHEEVLQALQCIVPPLTTDSYKGQSGKVGVMGGCREYTGAPYFAAMSALRMGCDLAYVFCAPSAAPVIKSYSPELIVIPALRESYDCMQGWDPNDPPKQACNTTVEDDVIQRCKSDLKTWLSKLSVLIIGPGLGDDWMVGRIMCEAVEEARELGLTLLIDGSGLNFIAKHPQVIQGYQNCLLTPNIAEFGRLAAAVGVELPGKIGVQWQLKAKDVAAALSGPVLLSKGQHDIITDGRQLLLVTQEGSPRRCGGQGDVLTGTTAAFISWVKAQQRRQQQQQQQESKAGREVSGGLPPLMLAAYGGCLTMRAAAVLCFAEKGRSMVAGDMISHLGDCVLQQTRLL